MTHNASDSALIKPPGLPGAAAFSADAASHPSAARLALIYGLLFIVSQVPLYAVEYPDITDFPNHLARLHVLEHLAHSEWLQRYYLATPQAIFPNLAMESIVPLMSGWLGTVLALKIFASLTTLLITSGAIALARAFTGRVTYLTLGVVLFSNNAMFQFGLFNYLFGLGIAFWLLAAWILTPKWRVSVPGALSFTIGAAILYLCHLGAFGVYAVGVVALSLKCGRASGFGGVRELVTRGAAAVWVPLFAVAILHLVIAEPPSEYLIRPSPTPLPALLLYKLSIPFLMVSKVFSGYGWVGMGAGVLTVVGVYASLRRGVVTINRTALHFVAAVALVAMLVPPAVLGSNLVDMRLLLAVAVIFWCGLDIRDATWSRSIFFAVTAGCVALNAAILCEWARRDQEYRDARQALMLIERGSTLATVALDDGATRISPHVGGWAVIDRSVMLSSLYARPFQPVWLAYCAQYVPLAARARTENLFAQSPPGYAGIKDHFQYLLVVGSDPKRETYGSQEDLIYQSSSVRLVRTEREAFRQSAK